MLVQCSSFTPSFSILSGLGIFLQTASSDSGIIPQSRKPDLMFVSIFSIFSISFIKRARNSDLRIQPLLFIFPLSKHRSPNFLNGCGICVPFGDSNTKWIWFCSQHRITCIEMWAAKLSPIKTFLPRRILSNQSSHRNWCAYIQSTIRTTFYLGWIEIYRLVNYIWE